MRTSIRRVFVAPNPLPRTFSVFRRLMATTSTERSGAQAVSAATAAGDSQALSGVDPGVMESLDLAQAAQTEIFYASTRLPLDQASTLPPEVYHRKEIIPVEKARVWEASWTCVGITSQLARHGDTIHRQVGSQGVIITRDKKGKLHAFMNVCRHRGAQLVRKDGRYPILSCKYHRWGYSLDGKLVAAPLFSYKDEDAEAILSDENFDPTKHLACDSLKDAFERKDFDKADFPLIRVRMDTLGHMIFVNIDGKAPPLAEYLGASEPDGGLPRQISEHLQTLCNVDPKSDNGLVSVRQKRVNSDANWKLLVENFIEYYHLPSVHPSLCAVSGVDDHHRAQASGNHIGFITQPISAGGTPLDPNVLPHFKGLGDANNQTAWFHAIFPNVFYFLLPHSVFTVIVSPDYAAVETDRGSGVTDVAGFSIEHLDLSVSKEALDMPDSEAKIEEMWNFYDHTNDEDIDICQTVQKGIRSQGYKGGRYSFRFEETIHRYQNMYIDHMIGCPRVVPGDGRLEPGASRFIYKNES